MRESQDRLKKRAGVILGRLKRTYPASETALGHSTALELLIATILSAKCTDERVNKVTPELFRRYRTAHDYAAANRAALEQEQPLVPVVEGHTIPSCG